jgi:hypothetical protein
MPRAQWGHYALGDFNMTNKPSFTKILQLEFVLHVKEKKCWLKMISKDHQNVFYLDTFF